MRVEDMPATNNTGYADAWAQRQARSEDEAYMEGYQEGVEEFDAAEGRRFQGKRSEPGFDARRYQSHVGGAAKQKKGRPMLVKGGGDDSAASDPARRRGRRTSDHSGSGDVERGSGRARSS